MTRILHLLAIFIIAFATSAFGNDDLLKLVKKAIYDPDNSERWARVEKYIEDNPGDNSEAILELIRPHNSLLYFRLAYEIQGDLGVGAFGTVKKARHRFTGEYFAIKTLRRVSFEELHWPFPPREVELMRRLKHPNIVELRDVVSTDEAIYLILEFFDGKELFYHAFNRELPEAECRNIMRQLLSAVAYAHEVGVCHRDINLQNIMINEAGEIKLIDFGLGNFFKEHQTLSTVCGSDDFVAPEILAGRRYHGPNADVWNLGCVLYTLATGYLPFGDENDNQLINYHFIAYHRCQRVFKS